jgi:hypothetical protein
MVATMIVRSVLIVLIAAALCGAASPCACEISVTANRCCEEPAECECNAGPAGATAVTSRAASAEPLTLLAAATFHFEREITTDATLATTPQPPAPRERCRAMLCVWST